MYIDNNGYFAKNFEITDGWFYRIDPPRNGVQRHIHVFRYRGGNEYAQNEDGSVHEGYSGMPPRWIRRWLRDTGKWDWKESNVEPSSPLPKDESKDTSKSSSKPSKKRSKEKSNVKNDYADEVATAGILTLIVAGVWTVAKIAAIPYTGGLSLIVP